MSIAEILGSSGIILSGKGNLVFTDESGIAPDQPVTVVAGVIVNHFSALIHAIGRVNILVNGVPEKHRPDGVLPHATTILNGKDLPGWDGKDVPDWPLEERLSFLKGLMAIPHQLGMTVAFAAYYRDGHVPDDMLGMRKDHFQHAQCFGYCMAQVNRYLDACDPGDTKAVVCAEDIPPMRERLIEAMRRLQEGVVTIPSATLYSLIADEIDAPRTETLKFETRRIAPDITFKSKKDNERLLTIADAIAFGIMRYLGENNFQTVEFMQTMMGGAQIRPLRPGTNQCVTGYVGFLQTALPIEDPFARSRQGRWNPPR